MKRKRKTSEKSQSVKDSEGESSLKFLINKRLAEREINGVRSFTKKVGAERFFNFRFKVCQNFSQNLSI